MSHAVFLFLLTFTHRNYKVLYGPHILLRGKIQFSRRIWWRFSTNHLNRKNMIGMLPWPLIAVQLSRSEGPVIMWCTIPGSMRWASHTLIVTQVCFYIMRTAFFQCHLCYLAFGYVLFLFLFSLCRIFVNCNAYCLSPSRANLFYDLYWANIKIVCVTLHKICMCYCS